MGLEDKVQRLLKLLTEVEEEFDPRLLQDPQLGPRLIRRLRTVADRLEDSVHSEEESDEESDESLMRPWSQEMSASRPKSRSELPDPQSLPVHEFGTQSQDNALESQTAGSRYKDLYRPRKEVLDEPARKRRREASEMVKNLKRTESLQCGCSYTDGENERKFSDNSKKEIKKLLPDLKTNKHLFHYMVFATLEHLNCDYCRQCPNTAS